MRFLCFLGMMLLSVSVMANDISMPQVQLRAIDKTTGHMKTLTATIGQPLTFSAMTIMVEKCLQAPPEEKPENSAFITIYEKALNTENQKQKQVFSGWMFSSNPALSAMEHAVYDVWVLKCVNDTFAQ